MRDQGILCRGSSVQDQGILGRVPSVQDQGVLIFIRDPVTTAVSCPTHNSICSASSTFDSTGSLVFKRSGPNMEANMADCPVQSLRTGGRDTPTLSVHLPSCEQSETAFSTSCFPFFSS